MGIMSLDLESLFRKVVGPGGVSACFCMGGGLEAAAGWGDGGRCFIAAGEGGRALEFCLKDENSHLNLCEIKKESP